MIVSSSFCSATVNEFLSSSEHTATVEFMISSAIVDTWRLLKLTENTFRNAAIVSLKSEQDKDALDKSGLLLTPSNIIVIFGLIFVALSKFCLVILSQMMTLTGSLLQTAITSPIVSSYLRHLPKAAMHLVLNCTNFLRYFFDTR